MDPVLLIGLYNAMASMLKMFIEAEDLGDGSLKDEGDHRWGVADNLIMVLRGLDRAGSDDLFWRFADRDFKGALEATTVAIRKTQDVMLARRRANAIVAKNRAKRR